ncbi:radical SAM protein [Streptomyces sp. LBUM 1476]|nr:radical SAM protein [Streptomyces sp. LBUM 1476]
MSCTAYRVPRSSRHSYAGPGAVPSPRRGGTVPSDTQLAVTFSQFVVKLHSRCDFACPDCYVYALRDTGWSTQPRAMPYAIRELTARRIADHVRAHRPTRARVMLHGGEPLLAGPRRIAHFAQALHEQWRGLDTPLDLVVQTNGAQIKASWLDVFQRYGIRVGVSLDGTREAHDRRRRRASGRGTYDDVLKALELLRARPSLYAGLLCTVDLAADPVETYEALLKQQPPSLDFLLPLGTRQHPPPGLESGAPRTPAGSRRPSTAGSTRRSARSRCGCSTRWWTCCWAGRPALKYGESAVPTSS